MSLHWVVERLDARRLSPSPRVGYQKTNRPPGEGGDPSQEVEVEPIRIAHWAVVTDDEEAIAQRLSVPPHFASRRREWSSQGGGSLAAKQPPATASRRRDPPPVVVDPASLRKWAALAKAKCAAALLDKAGPLLLDDCRDLDSAEDELGAVLWNANTAVLDHFCRSCPGDDSDRTTTKRQEPNSEQQRSRSAPASRMVENELDEGAPLAAAMANAPGQLKILELGAGVGALGIGLAAAIGADVMLSDMAAVVPLMELNVALNYHDDGTDLMMAPPAVHDYKSEKKIGRQAAEEPSCHESTPSAAVIDLPVNAAGGRCGVAHIDWRRHHFCEGLRRWLTSRRRDDDNNTARNCRRRGVVGDVVERGLDIILMVDALYGNAELWDGLITLLEKISVHSCGGASSHDDRIADRTRLRGEVTSAIETSCLGQKRRRTVDSATTGERGREQAAIASPTPTVGKRGASEAKEVAFPLIVNYCEQRVANVEDGFLERLRQSTASSQQDGTAQWQVSGPFVLRHPSNLKRGGLAAEQAPPPSADARSELGMEVRVSYFRLIQPSRPAS